MKQSILKQVSKKDKIQFLTKLQTGKYIIGHANNPQTELNFLRIESGLYQCVETGNLISKEQAEALEGSYLVMIEIISDLKQAPTGYQFIPFPQDQILNQLLKPKE